MTRTNKTTKFVTTVTKDVNDKIEAKARKAHVAQKKAEAVVTTVRPTALQMATELEAKWAKKAKAAKAKVIAVTKKATPTANAGKPSTKAFKAVKLAKIAEAQAQTKAARAARKELRLKQRAQIEREDATAAKVAAGKANAKAALKAKDKATKKRTPAQKAKASEAKTVRPSLLTAVAEVAFSHARSSSALLKAVLKAGGNIDPVKKAFYEGSIAHKLWPNKLVITEDMRAQVRAKLKALSKMDETPAKALITQAYSTARTYFTRFCEKNGLENMSPSGKGGKGRGRKPGSSKAELKAKKAIKAAMVDGSTDSKEVSPVTGDLTTQISPKKMTRDIYAAQISHVSSYMLNFANKYAANADPVMAELIGVFTAGIRARAEEMKIGTQPEAPNADKARAAEKLMELHKAKANAANAVKPTIN